MAKDWPRIRGKRRQAQSLEKRLSASLERSAHLQVRSEVLQTESDARGRELQLALGVQRSFLPRRTQFPGVKVFTHLEPARGVGGDFYDFVLVEDGGRHLISVIADVAGKGISAALMMALAIAVFREAVRHSRWPDVILQRANRLLMENSPEQEHRFVSAAVAALDVERGRLHYSAAGHEDALLWRKRSGRIYPLKSSGMLLGVDPDASYGVLVKDFHSGDRLLLHTDGLTDALNRNRERFESRRLHDILRGGTLLDIDTLGRTLIAEVDAFRHGTDVNDDITLVIVEADYP